MNEYNGTDTFMSNQSIQEIIGRDFVSVSKGGFIEMVRNNPYITEASTKMEDNSIFTVHIHRRYNPKSLRSAIRIREPGLKDFSFFACSMDWLASDIDGGAC